MAEEQRTGATGRGEILREIGATGLRRQSGVIQEEFLRQLSGPQAIRVYREMRDNDPVVGAILFAVEMLVRQVSWRVEPASDSNQDLQAAEFLRSCMEDMSHTWQTFISEALSMLVYGWSFHEIVYKVRGGDSRDPTKRSRFNDGRIGWRKLPIRAQDTLLRWEFDDEGGIRGMWQSAPPSYTPTFIPIEKGLLFRTTSHKGDPQGRSVLRNAYRPWYFKRRIEEIEGIGVERDLAGLPVAWVPPEIMSDTATPEQRAVFESVKKLVSNIRRDEQEGVVMPLAYDERGNQLFKLELLTTGGRRQFDTSAIIQRYDQRIAMTILADFILLGHEKVGSYALSSSKAELFAVALGAWLDEIQEVLNRHAVPRLFALNDFKLEKLPNFVHGAIEQVDLKELGEYIRALAGAGMPLFPTEDGALERYLLEAANLPTSAAVPAGE